MPVFDAVLVPILKDVTTFFDQIPVAADGVQLAL